MIIKILRNVKILQKQANKLTKKAHRENIFNENNV